MIRNNVSILQSFPSALADGKMFGVICVFSHIDVINLKKRLKPFELHPLIRQLGNLFNKLCELRIENIIFDNLIFKKHLSRGIDLLIHPT
jgi:hypothetical protein